MSVTVEFQNFTTSTFAHPLVPGGVDAFASGAPGTDTRTFNQVNADDYSANYDSLAAFGVAVKEGSTYRTGIVEHTATGTIADTTHIVIADTTAGIATLTLPAVGTVGEDFRMWIFLEVDGGDLTIEGNAAETVMGAANQVMTAAGDMLALISTATGWDEQ